MGSAVLLLPDFGDANPYQRRLADALAERGLSVSTATGTGALPIVSAVRDHGRPEVVHLHWLHPYLVGRGPITTALKGARLVVELLVLRVFGVTLVWTVHNLLEHDRRAPRTEAAVKHAVIRLVTASIVHCESARRAVSETFRLSPRQRAKLAVIPHGHYAGWYPRRHTRRAARRSLDLPREGTVFLFFGRIHPYKNVGTLVEAFGSLADDEARLLIAGKPSDQALADEVVAASESDRRVCHRLEYIPDAEVQRYFAAADAVVVPYRDVLSSGTAVLAASFRRAIVAPRRGCVVDRFADASGLIYDPEGGGLPSAIERALEVDLRAVGSRNYSRVREPSWRAIAAATAATYGLRSTGPDATTGVTSPY